MRKYIECMCKNVDVMVDILLSTYNGEKFIKEQIDSIINQTYRNWRLIIRDDGSTDNTINIIRHYIKNYKNKIILITDLSVHIGIVKSYSYLMKYSKSNYIMFCDQDDIWLPEKIEASLDKMTKIEESNLNKPILVHTNLIVVDDRLNIINNSFWNYQRLNKNNSKLNNLLIQNNITGCTVIINRKLKELCNEIPKEAMMHDWWLALISSAFGVIDYIDKPTILYRQHGKNSIGAKRYKVNHFIPQKSNLGKSLETNLMIINQAKKFLTIFKRKMDRNQVEMLENYSYLFAKNRIQRIYTIIKYKIFKYPFAKNLGFIINMLFYYFN